MKLDVRARMLVWLAIVLVPIMLAGYVAVQIAGDQISSRVASDLEHMRQLEAARIDDVLDNYTEDAVSLVSGVHVTSFTTGIGERRAGSADDDLVIGGVDGFEVIDAFAERPLDELVDAMQNKATSSGSEVVAIRIVDTSGALLGATLSSEWEPYDDTLVATVASSAEPKFGNAFRSSAGDDRLGLVTPIAIPGEDPVGLAMIEFSLEPITNLLVEHERLGNTSEAHLAQPDASGNAEFISILRFERDSAFTKVVPKEKQLPINQSLESPDGQIVRAGDYRQEPSILAIETIEQTGWGLVVKVDASEADEPAIRIRNIVLLAGLAAVAAVALGWALLLRPLGHRLRQTALAAQRVAAGDYDSRIGDTRSDEIGEMARSIDRLAGDLAADIEIRAEAERQLRLSANRDGLTGLLNRKRLAEILDEADINEEPDLSILFADLDGFKTVNDTFGHQVGDEVLVAVAQRFANAVGDEGLVARWGGDEFVVALIGETAAHADEIADRIGRVFEAPIDTTVGQHDVRASLGRATARPGVTSRAVLNEADAAMLAGKQASRGRQVISSSTLRAVELALDEDRVDVWYQPIIGDGESSAVYGAEALVRLRNTDGTLAAPAEFLPAIQDMYLGALLDRRVMSRALGHLAEWQRHGMVPDDFRLAVNLSGASARDTDLVDFLVAEAAGAGVQLDHIVVEVSEETESLDLDVIGSLREAGVLVAIDDVGLTYSNVDRLIDLHADIAKIDRRWLVDGPDADSRTLTALRSIIGLCSSLGMRVVAEGVERTDQLDLLRRSGVDHFQGYHFARPAPADQFAGEWLAPAGSELVPNG